MRPDNTAFRVAAGRARWNGERSARRCATPVADQKTCLRQRRNGGVASNSLRRCGPRRWRTGGTGAHRREGQALLADVPVANIAIQRMLGPMHHSPHLGQQQEQAEQAMSERTQYHDLGVIQAIAFGATTQRSSRQLLTVTTGLITASSSFIGGTATAVDRMLQTEKRRIIRFICNPIAYFSFGAKKPPAGGFSRTDRNQSYLPLATISISTRRLGA